MLSLIITFFLIGPFLIFKDKNNDSKYLTYASTLSISYCSLGLVSLFLIYTKLTFLPLYILLIFLFLIFFSVEKYKYKFIFFCNQFLIEINLLKNMERYKKTFNLFFSFLIILLIISIGPINHVDTVNIYVGYPYKFLIQNSHFFDGNLMQGLMGVGDFANIFYFQEKTTWLIRTSQFIPIIFLLMYMLKRNLSNIIILIFLTSPVMIQWLTIGKNNFLSESCLALSFLVWEKNKEKAYLPYIFCLSFIAISFKISAVLISAPILIYIIFYYRKSLIKINFQKILSLPLIFSFLALISIFTYRYFFIENPLYPLFSNIFSPGDQQLLDWEKTLKGWDREGFFLFWIFIPKSIGKISFVLGPANLFLFIFGLMIYLKNFIFRNPLLTVAILQFLFLITFSQGRADYYMAPLIIISFASEMILFKDLKFLGLKFYGFLKPIFFLSFFIQLMMFLISALYSVALVAYVIFDYEGGMNKTAYNFYNSNKIEKIANLPVYSEVSGMTHLFFDKQFIANQKFERCFYYGKKIPVDQKYKLCMNKEDVKTIIVEKNMLKDSKYFSCKNDSLIRASRNIFLEKKIEVDVCELN